MKIILSIWFSALSLSLFSQENKDWKTYPGSADTVRKTNEKTTEFNLNYNAKQGDVKVVKDEKIQKLTDFSGTPQKNEPAVKIKGFRVQLFFDSDKDIVNQKRSDYLARFSEHPAYIDYLQPNFRLRAGNFRTKLQAQFWANELILDFPDAIIVEDWIDLPALKKEEKK